MRAEEIAQEILNHRKGEYDNHALHLAVGRVHVNIKDLSISTFWIFNSELDKRVGNYESQRYVANKYIEKGVAKNSRMGEFLIRRKSGLYKIDKKEHNISIKDFSTYQPVNRPRIDAIKGTIEITGKKKLNFNSLYDFVAFAEEVKEETKTSIDQLIIDRQEALELGKILSATEQEQIKKLTSLTHYIRANNVLRMQPILDETQEEIKRSRIFNGVLIIDGGPGTGKTTTLIQRIKFLTDDTITEYGEQFAQILTQLQGKSGWVFFTPSTQLLGYLRNAMSSEGLSATDETSKVWENYINNELLKNYGLVGADKPFQLYRNPIGYLFPNDAALLEKALSEFETFIITQISTKIKKQEKVKLLYDDSKKTGNQIQRNATSVSDVKDLVRLVVNADELKIRFSKEFEQQAKEIRALLQEYSDTILVRLRRDDQEYNIISKHLKELFDKRQQVSDEEDEDAEGNENAIMASFNEELEIRKAVRTWLQKLALNRASTLEKIQDKQLPWIEKVENYATGIPLEELGKKIHFIKYVQPVMQGSSVLVFNRIATYYKGFRKQLPAFFKNMNLPVSAERITEVLSSDISRLHYDERNFLILFINTLIRKLQKFNAFAYANNEHHFINVCKEHQRYLVAIDEASDFSLVELACMHSFSHPAYNCTTLSGDLMQRMTNTGINSWERFINYAGDGEIKHLKISYRQSPGLLKIAKDFYESVTGKKANYISYTEPSTAEPRPVFKRIELLQEKAKWISSQIMSIYKTYDNQIPSIAIFVPDDAASTALTKQLMECDELPDNGIEVRSITQVGAVIDKAQVSIYNIENIKGLEFEAVFFIDIDQIKNSDAELLKNTFTWVFQDPHITCLAPTRIKCQRALNI